MTLLSYLMEVIDFYYKHLKLLICLNVCLDLKEKSGVHYCLANQMPNPKITQKKLKWVKDEQFKALGG